MTESHPVYGPLRNEPPPPTQKEMEAMMQALKDSASPQLTLEPGKWYETKAKTLNKTYYVGPHSNGGHVFEDRHGSMFQWSQADVDSLIVGPWKEPRTWEVYVYDTDNEQYGVFARFGKCSSTTFRQVAGPITVTEGEGMEDSDGS